MGMAPVEGGPALRRACIYKERLGEVGEGNCRRYRRECGGRVSYCERLRRACIYKEERGEVGYGNCRRYREECRSRRYDRICWSTRTGRAHYLRTLCVNSFAAGDAGRFQVSGPPILITPDAAQTLGLALHELHPRGAVLAGC